MHKFAQNESIFGAIY